MTLIGSYRSFPCVGPFTDYNLPGLLWSLVLSVTHGILKDAEFKQKTQGYTDCLMNAAQNAH